MSAYELYLALHIGGAILWVGAAFALALLTTRARLAADAERAAGFAVDAEWLGLRLFLPLNLLVLGSAVLLVQDGGWGWGELWIQLGLAGFAISFVAGFAVLAPGWARVVKLVGAEGAASAAVRARISRLLLVSWLDVGVLAGVIFVMAVKPTGGEVGGLVAAGAIPALVAGLAIALRRAESGGRQGAPAATEPS
jgi:hypothetical protein